MDFQIFFHGMFLTLGVDNKSGKYEALMIEVVVVVVVVVVVLVVVVLFALVLMSPAANGSVVFCFDAFFNFKSKKFDG